MLEATVDGGNYQVARDGDTVATLQFQGTRESGAIIGGHGHLTIRREHAMSGAWLLEQQDGGAGTQVVATAEKPSAKRSDFILQMPGRPALQLDRPSAWKPVFALTEADRAVGTIRRVRSLRPRFQADIGDDVPPTLQLFALWAALLLIRRAENARKVARRAR
jgi:hypothetical protein